MQHAKYLLLISLFSFSIVASAQTQPDCPDESIAEFAETLENDGPDGCTQCQGCEFPENMTWDEIMSGNGELTESSEIFGPLTVEDIKNDNGDNPEDPEGDIEIQQDNLIGLLNTINQQVDLKKMVDCININCLTDLTYFNYINLDSLNDILIADGQNAVTEEDLDNIQETLGYLNMDSLAMVAFCGPIGFDDCTYQGPCGTIQTKPSSRGGENDYDKAELDLFSHQIIGIEKAGTVPNLPNASYSDAFHDAEIDVDLYNGIPTVRFPLITFTSKDISFDLSAINHGKGVIVNEYGGVLGQSWDLSGIPTITRTIKGFPDESIITSTGYGMGPSPTLKLCTKVAGMCFTLAKPAKIFRYSWKEPTKLHIHVFIAAIPNSTGVNVYLSLDFVIELNVRFKPSHIDYEEKIVGFQELTNAGVMSSEFGTSNPTIGDVQNLTYPEKAKYGYKAAGTKNIEDFQFLVPKAGLIVNFLKGGANLFTNPLERRKKMDTEADEFSYNLGNYSGKFVIEQDGGTIILLPKQNVIIIPSYSTINGVRVLSKFTVQTPEGLVYTFGKSTGECVDFHYLTNYVMPNQYAYPETNSNRRRFGKAGVLESELPFRGMLLCFPRALKYGSTYETAYTVMNSPSYAAKWNLVQVKSLVSNEIVNLNYSTQPVELVYNVQKNWQHDFPDFASNGAELECAPHDPDIIALTGQPLSQWQAGTANLSLTISEKHERNYLLQSINGQNGDKLEFIYEKSAPEVVNKAFCSAIHYKIDDHFSKGWAFIYDDVIQPLQFDCNVESSNSVTTYSATNEMVYNLGEVVAKPIYSVLSYTYLLLPTGKFQQFYLPHGGPIWDQRWHNGKQLREFGSLVKIKRYSNTLDWEKEKVQFQGESSRTFLKSIQEIDRDMGMHPVLTVDYTKKDELPSLPKRFSVNQDLWGYYNDNSLSKSLLPKIIYEGYDGQWISAPNPAVMNHYGFSTDGDVALGHNINTSAERCVIGSLNKLLLETGGIYEFKYESIKMPGNVYGGGFRVKSLIKNPNAGPQQVRMYEYANAKPANYPIRSFKNIYNFDSHSKQRYISTSSVPQNDWLLNKNHFIGYENVKVNYIGNGFIKFRFSPIEVGIIREVGYLNDVVRRTTTAVSTYALSLPIPYEYDDFDLGIINPSEVGQLLESTSFGEDGIMESKSSYTYELFNSVNNDDIHSLQLMTNITRYPGIFADNKGIGEVFNAITTYAAAYSDVLKYFLMAFEVVTGTRKIHQYSKFRYLSYNRFISNSLLASETSSRYYPSGSSGYTKTYSYQQAGPYLLSVKDQTTYTDGSTVVNKVYFPQTADSDFLKLNGSDHSLLLTAKIALALKTESFLNGENDAHRTSGSINVLTYANSRFVTSDLWESLCGIWRLKARFSNFTDGLPQKYQIAKFGDGGLASPDGFSFFEDIDLTWSHRMLMQKRLYGSSIVQDFLYTPYRELELTNDRNGVVSDYEYDNRGRLYKAIKNNGRQTTTYEYSFQPNVFSSTASFQDGTTEQKISEEFDGFAHLLKKIRNGSSVLELNTYDEMFRPIQTKAIGSGPILNTYSKSPAGDLLKTVDAVGNKTEFAYKGNNVDGFQSTSIKDANDHISIKSVDALGRVTKTSSAEGGQTVYGYDALGRLGSVGNPIQENYLFHYNDMGKLTSKLVPSSNPENSWYDERFRLAATSDANGHQFIYLYDELDRLNDIYQMDPPVLLPNTGLINASDAQQLSGSGIRMQHIDYVTNKTWVRQTFDRVLGESIGEEFKQMELGTWDDLGRGTELTYTYPDGIIKETIGYNDANLIVLDRKLFEGSLLNGFESKYNYTFSEHLLPHKTYLTTNVFHQFLLSEEIYNLEDQLTVKKLSGLAGTVLQNIDYGYDAAGRLVRINEPMSTACMKDVEYCTLDLNYSITAGCNIVKGINLGLSDVIFPTIVTLPSDVQLLQEYIDQALYDQGLYGHSVVKLENPGQGEPQNLLVWIYETNASSAYLIFPTNHICPELWRFNSSNCCTFQSGPIEADPPIGHPMTAGKPTPVGPGSVVGATPLDLFAERLKYNGLDISVIEMINHCSTGKMRTAQTYDGDHRLRQQEVTTFSPTPTGDRYDTDYTYDLAGNLLTLNRRGLVDLNTETYDWIDKLVYTYPSAHSSQLSKVQDLSTGAGQPIGLKPIESKLSYNAAGAITYDMGKGLNTSYNEINLPKAVTDGSKFVNFDYTFSGEKIRRKGDGTEGYTQVNYFQGAEVYDGVLQSYYHPEGRIRFEDVNTQHLEFTLQDHLGNSVVTFEDINQDGEIVTETDPGTLEVYQRHYYYPFGLEMKGEWTQDGSPKMLYRYNGKEFLSDVGSNMLDYGARYHMPEIGRWGAVDPMASKYPSLSPYAYVANDPINAIDPDGRYILPAALAQKYSKLAGYLQNGIGNLLNRKDIRSGLRTIGNFNDDQIDQLARYGEGIPIDIKQLDNDAEHSTHGEINGYTPGNGSIQIDETLAQQLQDASTPEAEAAALLGVVSTILHETTHQGFNTNPVPYNSASREITDGNFSRTYNPNKDLYSYYFQGNQVGTSGETGEAFENSIWYNGGKNTNFGFDRKQGTTGMQNQSRLYKINFFTGNYNNLPETSNK